MSNDLVLAAFQETPLNAANPDRAYEVDASLKDAFKRLVFLRIRLKVSLKRSLQTIIRMKFTSTKMH